MKKWLIAALLAFVLILLALSAILCVRFLSLYNEAMPDPASQPEQAPNVLAYAQENWPRYAAGYDAASNTLTLCQPTNLTFDEACAFGGSVYSNANAPQTYFSEVSMIALSAAIDCNLPSLSVMLCYESSDGQTIFYVKSDGTVWTCWE